MTLPLGMLKQMLPTRLRRLARFAYRLPVHFREDYSYQICAERKYGHGTIAIADDVVIELPDHAVASSVFRSMAFEKAGAEETKEFLWLAQGCRSLVDLGASGGYFSAVFARSRQPCRVLSIEFDKPSLLVLEQTKARNGRPEIDWVIDSRGISDKPETVEIVSSGYGGVVATEVDKAEADQFAIVNRRVFESYQMKVDRLETICAEHNFRPDMMKVDIEGYEHEMITSSLELLGGLKPRLAFELHVDKLARQGKSAERLLSLLGSIGYRIARTGQPALEMLRMVDAAGVARAGLSAQKAN